MDCALVTPKGTFAPPYRYSHHSSTKQNGEVAEVIPLKLWGRPAKRHKGHEIQYETCEGSNVTCTTELEG